MLQNLWRGYQYILTSSEGDLAPVAVSDIGWLISCSNQPKAANINVARCCKKRLNTSISEWWSTAMIYLEHWVWAFYIPRLEAGSTNFVTRNRTQERRLCEYLCAAISLLYSHWRSKPYFLIFVLPLTCWKRSTCVSLCQVSLDSIVRASRPKVSQGGPLLSSLRETSQGSTSNWGRSSVRFRASAKECGLHEIQLEHAVRLIASARLSGHGYEARSMARYISQV